MKFNILRFSEIDSTNKEVFRILSERNAKEGLVVTTSFQTEGRGTGKNIWESQRGMNLLFSLLLQPLFLLPEKQFVLTQMISLALFDVLEKKIDKQKLRIKWPNDIWYENKKLAGVLVQNSIRGTQFVNAVIGVGLNVNQIEFSAKSGNPVSLRQITGNVEDIQLLLQQILQRVAFYYDMLKTNVDFTNESYLCRLYRYRVWSTYKDEKGMFVGKIIGVDRYGRLSLLKENGEKYFYGFKEIKFLSD